MATQYLPYSHTGELRARLTAGTVPSGTPVRVVTHPVIGASSFAAVEICGDGKRPHAAAATPLDDVSVTGSIRSVASANLLMRSGDAFAVDDALVVKSGKIIKAAAGEQYYLRALAPATGPDDLVPVYSVEGKA